MSSGSARKFIVLCFSAVVVVLVLSQLQASSSLITSQQTTDYSQQPINAPCPICTASTIASDCGGYAREAEALRERVRILEEMLSGKGGSVPLSLLPPVVEVEKKVETVTETPYIPRSGATSNGTPYQFHALVNQELTLAPVIDSVSFDMNEVEEVACTTKGPAWMIKLHSSEPKDKSLLAKGGSPSISTTKWICGNVQERRIAAIMLHVFDGKCSDPSNPGLMLDIGSNVGYFGMLGLRGGCEVLAFDLQVGCQKFINNAIVMNGYEDRGRVVPCGVGSKEGTVKVAGLACDGRYPVSAKERNTFNPNDGQDVFIAPLSKFIDASQEIAIMKIDTEGNENHVLQGAMSFFENRRVLNAVVEITPGVPKFWAGAGTTLDQVVETFRTIANHGYIMISIYDWTLCETSESVAQYIRGAAKVFQQGDLWLIRRDKSNPNQIADLLSAVEVFKTEEKQEGERQKREKQNKNK
jgi:FkbM family methyltransferase